MIAKVCDRKSGRDTWFENRLVLFRYFEVFKIDFNMCENQKNEWSFCCLLERINIDLLNFPYFVW